MCGLKPIRTEAEYETALARVESLMNAQLSGREAEEFDLLVDLVELYEFRHIPMPAPDLTAAIKYRLEEQGWTVQKLDSMIGDDADVGAILSGRKPMTMPVAIGLHKHLGLDEEVLLKGATMRY